MEDLALLDGSTKGGALVEGEAPVSSQCRYMKLTKAELMRSQTSPCS